MAYRSKGRSARNSRTGSRRVRSTGARRGAYGRRTGSRQRSNQQTVRVVLETVASPAQGAFSPLTATSEPSLRRRSIF